VSEEPQSAQAVPPAVPSANKKGKRITVASVFVFLWALWMGWHSWNSSTSSEKPRLQWEDKTIAPRTAVLRQELSEIESRPVSTLDDYVSNTLETQAIVEEAKNLIQRQMVMITRFKEANTDNASDADYGMRLTEKDEQLMQLLTDEIGCANTMKGLPASKRLAYYKANVVPVKEKEAQVVKEWMVIAKEAEGERHPVTIRPRSIWFEPLKTHWGCERRRCARNVL
jgi:hypothetical protein